MQKSFLLFLVIFGLNAESQTGPLVFIHGIKGAHLQNSSQERKWLTANEALGLVTPDLALPMVWNEGKQGSDDLKPEKVLEKIVVIPWLLEKNIYGKWIDEASSWGSLDVFTYDWRRDNNETLTHYETFLNQVVKDNKGRPAKVVAHSMGGLLTLALFNKRPELFEKIIFVGVPFRGGLGFLQDLYDGTSTGLNSLILTPKVLGTFPSVYSLFPLESRGVYDEKGVLIETDFFSAQTWRKNGWGLFKEDDGSDSKFAFLEKALAQAKSFRSLLKYPANPKTQILVVAAKNRPTFFEIQRESERQWNLKSRKKGDGDGRVLFEDAHPLGAEMKYELFETKMEHTDLLSDPEVQLKIKTF